VHHSTLGLRVIKKERIIIILESNKEGENNNKKKSAAALGVGEGKSHQLPEST